MSVMACEQMVDCDGEVIFLAVCYEPTLRIDFTMFFQHAAAFSSGFILFVQLTIKNEVFFICSQNQLCYTGTVILCYR